MSAFTRSLSAGRRRRRSKRRKNLPEFAKSCQDSEGARARLKFLAFDTDTMADGRDCLFRTGGGLPARDRGCRSSVRGRREGTRSVAGGHAERFGPLLLCPHRIRSTASLNGKRRAIVRISGDTPASATICRHSAGRNDRAIESCPSSRTIRCTPMRRARKG